MPKCRAGEPRAAAVLPKATCGGAGQRTTQPTVRWRHCCKGTRRQGQEKTPLGQCCCRHAVTFSCCVVSARRATLRQGRETTSRDARRRSSKRPGRCCLLPFYSVCLYATWFYPNGQWPNGLPQCQGICRRATTVFQAKHQPATNRQELRPGGACYTVCRRSQYQYSVPCRGQTAAGAARTQTSQTAGAREPAPGSCAPALRSKYNRSRSRRKRSAGGEHSHAGADPCFLLRVRATTNLGVWGTCFTSADLPSEPPLPQGQCTMATQTRLRKACRVGSCTRHRLMVREALPVRIFRAFYTARRQQIFFAARRT